MQVHFGTSLKSKQHIHKHTHITLDKLNIVTIWYILRIGTVSQHECTLIVKSISQSFTVFVIFLFSFLDIVLFFDNSSRSLRKRTAMTFDVQHEQLAMIMSSAHTRCRMGVWRVTSYSKLVKLHRYSRYFHDSPSHRTFKCYTQGVSEMRIFFERS